MIPACRLGQYLDFVTKALGPMPSSSHAVVLKDELASRYAIRRMDGTVWFAAPPTAIAILADAKQIYGTGSPRSGRLKYTTLTVPTEEAQATLDAAVENGRLKKHFALRVPMAEANFTVRHVKEVTGQYFEPIEEVCDGYARTPQMAMQAYVQEPR
jgi:hypothetical protein